MLLIQHPQPTGHLCGCGVQFISLTGSPISVDPEAVAGIAWKNMKVRMEDLLKCCLTISKKQIDALAPKATTTK